jgi:tetratricopeptide (TPR) repeat protein
MDEGLLQNAATHYGRMEYDKALEIYNTALENGITSSDLFYNLGNCYYQLQNFSLARLYYEKAKLMNPLDKVNLKNLKIVEEKIGVSDEVLFKNLPEHLIDVISGTLNSTHWSLIFIGMSWVLLILFFFKKRIWLGIAALVQAIVFFFGIVRFDLEKNSGYGIVYSSSDKIELQVAPEQIAEEVYEIKNGRKVLIEEELGEWNKIWIDGNIQGWIKADKIKKI